MARKQLEPPGAPAEAVASDSSSDEEGDETLRLSEQEEVESEEVESEEEEEDDEGNEEEEERGLMARAMQVVRGREQGVSSDVESMDGSRSRSEEDLRDIGSARRLDDDDTGDSAWKGAAGAGVDGMSDKGVAVEQSAGDGADASRSVEEKEEEEGEGGDAMEPDDEDGEEEEEEDEEESEREPSVSLEGDSDSDAGGSEKGESAKSSAYSRAFSKILQQSKVAKESETGPVLAARQTLVARKLEEEAVESKEKKVSKKEKKELREKAHLYPQSFTDSKEKDLVRLATRGVVKLFNAVSKAQKVQSTSNARDAKVVAKQSKSAFLAEVRGTGSSAAAIGTKRSLSSSSAPPFKFGKSESQKQPTSRWSVVKDDFMFGKQKLKDWDKDEKLCDAAGVQQLHTGIDDDSD